VRRRGIRSGMSRELWTPSPPSPSRLRYASGPGPAHDPNDEIVIEVASNGRADAIVTHNVKDFAPAQTLGIDIATPAEILRRLRQ